MTVSNKYSYTKAYLWYIYILHTPVTLLDWVYKIWLSIDAQIFNEHHISKDEITKELDIIKNCQKDPKYFAGIYLKYFDKIFIFVNNRIDSLDITADITSKIFLKCLKNIGKFRYVGVPFSSWLYKIAINEVNLFFRNEARFIRSVSIDSNDLGQLVNEIDYSEPLIDPHVLVPVLLEQLSEHDIQFIELRFFENRSFKEIGYLLGTSEVNAKIKTYRILKKLKKLSENIKYEQ